MVEILYNYEQYLSTKYLESTKETYLCNTNLFFKYLKKQKINPEEVTKADVYNYIAYMDNLKRSTIRTRLSAVKNYCKYQKLSDFLFEDIKLFDFNKKLPRILFSCQIGVLINYYKDTRNHLIIFLFLNTGIRISELANIQIENINFKEKYIYLKVKGGYFRKVFINETTSKKIKEYIKDRKKGSLFNLQRRQIHNIVTRPLKENNIKGSAHTLRHTFATEMYKQTHDILIVKELLGHKSIESTEIYTHLDNEVIKKAFLSNPLANFEVGGKK